MDLSNALRRLVFLMAVPVVCAGHDIEAAVQLAAPAVIVRAAYAGSQAVAFAKVQVFAPGGGETEFQTGLTDRRGFFSFVPEAAGVWRVVFDDEEGHRREVAVTVPEKFEGSAAGSGSLPVSRVERALTGIAMILGITGIWYGVKARKPS
ncbi:MAG: hypothetical protein JNK48_29760 [Bryobacterales bacterium]|nr:hypothetical protein [Bryobacterales bacterium]